MKENIEIEFKLLVSKEKFEELLSHYERAPFIKQINYYFDTQNNDLAQRKFALRIRKKGDQFIATLKIPQAEGVLEKEWYVSKAEDHLLNNDSELRKILHQYGIDDELYLVAALQTDRCMIVLEKAELCFDINEYDGIVDYEIEYEQTVPHDGRTAFLQIVHSVGLDYQSNGLSKIQRARLAHAHALD